MKPRKPTRPASAGKADEIIRLEDLAPRADAKGGRRKRLFGQEEPHRRTGREPR